MKTSLVSGDSRLEIFILIEQIAIDFIKVHTWSKKQTFVDLECDKKIVPELS